MRSNLNFFGIYLIQSKVEIPRLAISRHLSEIVNLESKTLLRKNGFLTCNSLCKERRSEKFNILFYLIILLYVVKLVLA